MSNFRDTVTYWEVLGSNGYGGNTYATPRKYLARWEDSQQTYIAPDGREVVSASQIFMADELVVGGYIILGDYSAITDPQTIRAREIRAIARVTNLRLCKALYTVYL